MISITQKKRNGRICGFTIEGHAGYADEGQDIVCAAVSVLSINTVNAMEKFTKDELLVDAKENGYLDCEVRGKLSHDCGLLLDTFWLGITEIAKQYGDAYIQVNA